jgi:hypothetical protein
MQIGASNPSQARSVVSSQVKKGLKGVSCSPLCDVARHRRPNPSMRPGGKASSVPRLTWHYPSRLISVIRRSRK